MDIIVGIDPGPQCSSYAVWDGSIIQAFGEMTNEKILGLLKMEMFFPKAFLVLEGLQNYGKIVGRDVFQTAMMIGGLLEASGILWGLWDRHILYRPAIKAYLCGTVRAKDKDIRSKLISILGHEVTYGVSSHIWSALAVAYVSYEIMSQENDLKKRKIS